MVGTADWDAWGNLRASSGALGTLGWTGELKDAATNLVYLRARDYSPGTGRFVQRDAVIPNAPGTQGYAPYAYANNSPVTFTDPSGHTGFQGNAYFAAGFNSGVAGVASLSLVASLEGVGPTLLAVGAWAGWGFLILAVVLLAMAVYIEVQQACAQAGLSMGECFDGLVEGRGWMDVVVGLSRAGLVGAGVVAGACVAQAGVGATGIDSYGLCPKPAETDCLRETVEDTLWEIVDLIGDQMLSPALAAGPADPYDSPPVNAARGGKGKRGGDNPCERRPDGPCHPIDDDAFFRKLAEGTKWHWQELQKRAEMMKEPIGIRPTGKTCVDRNGDVFTDTRYGRELIGNVFD